MAFKIDPASWSELNRLLDHALDLPQEERAGWLDSLSPMDGVLKSQLRELLARAVSLDGGVFLRTLPKVDVGDDSETRCDKPGDLIGPYKLIRELGAGGMGSVWLAERSDGMVNRPIALKLPHGAWRRAGLAERMAREREILATLEHPNIARLYDAGLASDGQPYLAIEFVEGNNIDLHCRDQQLDLKGRLKLFTQVGNAVAYAHAKLVVHRDLKPANILVTADGQVRLLDFGIAKLVEDGETKKSQLTEVSGRALSLEFASPEQILGEPLSIATDIYSLGVVLFELVTDQRPYNLKRESRGALEDAIVQGHPPRPSEVAEIGKRKALRGDLDTIVLKALKRKPEERYATANALVDDVFRYLDRLPVVAQPDSGWYRLRKFAQRQRLVLAGSLLVLIVIIAGAGVSIWQARVAIQERKRAEEVKEFVASIFREASPYSGAGTTTLSALDLLKQAEKKLGTSITEQPEVQVELSTLIGESLMALGDIAAAEPVLNRASTEARQVLGEHHDLTIRVALLQAQIHRMRGRAKEARAELDRILPMLRADTATKPLDLATALAHRTLIAIEETEYVDAERFAIEGDLLATAKLGYENEQTITSSILLALAYRYTKKFEQSRDAGQKAYHSALARFGESVPHPRVIEAKTAYARALADNGELAAGIALIDTAVADLRTLIGPDSFQVGITLQNLVAYRIDLGELALANSNGAEALKIVTANSQTESVTYAATLSARAQAHLAQRDGSALDEFNRAIPILTRLIGPEREATRLARTGKALSLAYLGRLEAAQEEIDSLMMNSKRKDGVASPMEPAAARAAQVRGTISRLRGDYATALQWQQPIADLENVGPKLQRERMRALAEVGLIRLEQGDATASATMFEQALKEFQRLESSITPAHVDALIGLGRARLAQGRSVEARPLLESADAFWRELDSESRWAGEAALWLGRCYQALGRSVEARDAIRRAEKIQRRSLLPADLMKPASTQSP